MPQVVRSRRAVVAAGLAIATALVVGLASPAAAMSAPTFSTFEGDCFATDGSSDIEIVLVTKLTDKAGLTPLFVSGHRVLVPHWARYNLQGGIGGLKSRHAGYQGITVTRPGPTTTTCEFTGQVVDEGELIGFTATVMGVMHGGTHGRPVGNQH